MNAYIDLNGKYYIANTAIALVDATIENLSNTMLAALTEGQIYTIVEMQKAIRLYNITHPLV